MKKTIAFLVALLLLCILIAPAMAQTPFRLSRVGTATLNYTNDLVVYGAILMDPQAIYVSGTFTNAAVVVEHRIGTITNQLYSKILSPTDRLIPLTGTNANIFKTDVLAVSGITNTATWILVGTER